MAPPIPLRDRLLGRPMSSSSKPKRCKSFSTLTSIARPTAKPKRHTSLPIIQSVELRKAMLNVAAGGEIYERAASRRARQRLALAEEAQGAVPLGRKQAQAQENKHETVWERQGQVVEPSSVSQKKASQKAMDWTAHEDFLESKRRHRLLNISQAALEIKQKPHAAAAATADAASNYHHRPTMMEKAVSQYTKKQQQQHYPSQKAAAVLIPIQQPPHRSAAGVVVVPPRQRTPSARNVKETKSNKTVRR